VIGRDVDAGGRSSPGRAGADPLQAVSPKIPATEVERIADAVFGDSGSISPLASERDQNVRVQDAAGRSFLLKIQNPADGRAVIEMQTRAVQHVAKTDPELPIPHVLPTRDGASWAEVPLTDGRIAHARLFTFLEGHNPGTQELGQPQLFAWGATVARLGRALRGFFHPAAGYEILWDVKHAPRLRPLLGHVQDPSHRALVEHALDRFDATVGPVLGSLRAQVVHNDMSLDNLLVDERGSITGITDFGDMTHTALVCDLAVTLADVLDGRPDAIDVAGSMVEGYRSVTPLEPEEAAVLSDLVAARCAAAIVISAWRLDLYPENAEYVSTFGGGAARLLQMLEKVGFDEAARRFQGMAAGAGPPSRRTPTNELLERRREVLGSAPLSYHRPVHLVRGEGVWMFDPDGRRYLDAYNNVPVVGHGHPRVVEAIAAQARTLNTNTRYLHEAVVELAERLLATMPGGLDRVLFVNSGSEANDVAWRIARAATGRPGAIISEFAYHGVTEATADLSPEEWPPGETGPLHVERIPAPDGYRGRHRRDEPRWAERAAADVADAAAALAGRGVPVAALFVDPAFTSDGVRCPPPEYLREAAGAVREAGGLLVADEVQAGFGRFGHVMWSFQASGMEPDLVTLGKPMGNGYPIAAIVSRSDLVDPFAKRTGFFSTFGGNPVGCAAALAVLDVIEDERLLANAVLAGDHLREGLRSLMDAHPPVGDVRGAGLMTGVELVRDRQTREPAGREAVAVVNGLRDRGVLVGATGPGESVLKIRPPLVFGPDHADLLVAALSEVLESLDT